MNKNQPKQPTDAQLFALITYANANGRTWKSKLNDDWMNGRADSELQQVRNQFGPTWLMRFKLPRVGPCCNFARVLCPGTIKEK